MERHKSALKRNRQNITNRLRNRSKRSFLRHQFREMGQLIESKNSEAAQQFFNKLTKTVDKAATSGIMHKRTAARHKSRISRKLNSMATAGKD